MPILPLTLRAVILYACGTHARRQMGHTAHKRHNIKKIIRNII